jgi:putative peptidoglycan lipid II flippase
MNNRGWRPAGQPAQPPSGTPPPRPYPGQPMDPRYVRYGPRHPRRPPLRPAARPGELSDAAVVSRSWGMAFATLISRITGFGRIVLLAAILGAPLASAFSVANQLPTLIAALVLEATFTAIFVPVLARAERDDPDGGAAFVRRLVTMATTLLVVVTALAVAGAPLLVRLMLGTDPQVNRPLTTAFAYLLLPQVLFYGLSSVFMAILNNRNVFGPTAWAPVVNNIVAIGTLIVYLLVPGELSVNPVHMGNTKLLVLGVGITLGVVTQAAVLLIAIGRQHISLRPMWGIDDRLKQFAAMAGAMVLYVAISQLGLVVGNRIASGAAASGPAIYNYTWLVLMLPFGMIGVTVLTVVMPRLSRNAAAEDIPAVLADLSLATRLTMITLIPIAAFMTVGGPAIGSALFAYGNFGAVDAGYLGDAIAFSAFTLIPYALVLLQLRVFYARQQPWTPIAIIVAITLVKVAASLLAPHLTADRELVAAYLGLANGLGFLAGATVGYILLRHALNPPRGHLLNLVVLRTILVTITASLLAGLVAHVVDRVAGLQTLTRIAGGLGSLLRLLALALIMVPIIAAIMLAAKVPDAEAARAAINRRIGRRKTTAADRPPASDRPRSDTRFTYAEHRHPVAPAWHTAPGSVRRGPPAPFAGEEVRKGLGVTNESAGNAAPDAATRLPRPLADDFQPDVAPEFEAAEETVVMPSTRRPPGDFAGDPTREPTAFTAPRETADSSRAEPHLQLLPGASVVAGRYRLLLSHGGPENLQFWQALDTLLDRQVSLTFVDPDGALPPEEIHEILARTQRLGRIDMPGIARVLDVIRLDAGGLVISEWIRGGSLKEVAETSPSPLGSARATQSLAAAAEAAHRAGVALSIDHPSRVRVSIHGDMALAFPTTMRGATPEDDVRGIGAALYALLANRWPLPQTGVPSGLGPAELDPNGVPVEPRAIDGEIPFQISAAAARAVRESGGITTASTLLNLLQQATAVADRTMVISRVDESEPPRAPARSRGWWAAGASDEETRARRRKGLLLGLGIAGAIIVVALLVIASFLSSIFGDVHGPLDQGGQLGLNPSTSQTQSAGSVVKPTAATVFSPGGGADNPGQATMAIDGNPATAWSTDVYTDAVPFPSFKSGVGLLLQLPQATRLASVGIDVPSTGTKVEIRSSPTATPAKLSDTTALTPPTLLQPGHNSIPVSNAPPTSTVLVWISTLGSIDGKSRTEISEITLQAAS